jgi:hypothetical protein
VQAGGASGRPKYRKSLISTACPVFPSRKSLISTVISVIARNPDDLTDDDFAALAAASFRALDEEENTPLA